MDRYIKRIEVSKVEYKRPVTATRAVGSAWATRHVSAKTLAEFTKCLTDGDDDKAIDMIQKGEVDVNENIRVDGKSYLTEALIFKIVDSLRPKVFQAVMEIGSYSYVDGVGLKLYNYDRNNDTLATHVALMYNKLPDNESVKDIVQILIDHMDVFNIQTYRVKDNFLFNITRVKDVPIEWVNDYMEINQFDSALCKDSLTRDESIIKNIAKNKRKDIFGLLLGYMDYIRIDDYNAIPDEWKEMVDNANIPTSKTASSY